MTGKTMGQQFTETFRDKNAVEPVRPESAAGSRQVDGMVMFQGDSSVEDIDFKLRARNSSGLQTLHLTGDKEIDEFWFTLTGEHNGKPIQVDFDTMTRPELEDLSVAMQLILSET